MSAEELVSETHLRRNIQYEEYRCPEIVPAENVWDVIKPNRCPLHTTLMLRLSGLQGVDPHELERWRDATFVMSKRVRHLDKLRNKVHGIMRWKVHEI
jgi:hypothetical protein